MPSTASSLWTTAIKTNGLRDTAPRRLVIASLSALGRPASAQEIHEWLKAKGHGVNLVTVYRIVEALTGIGLLHRQPSTGRVALCSQPAEKGHHLFLSCTRCRSVEEVCETALCKAEDAIARKHGFAPDHHVGEILGVCTHCTSSSSSSL